MKVSLEKYSFNQIEADDALADKIFLLADKRCRKYLAWHDGNKKESLKLFFDIYRLCSITFEFKVNSILIGYITLVRANKGKTYTTHFFRISSKKFNFTNAMLSFKYYLANSKHSTRIKKLLFEFPSIINITHSFDKVAKKEARLELAYNFLGYISDAVLYSLKIN